MDDTTTPNVKAIALRQVSIGAIGTDDYGRQFVPVIGIDNSGNPWATIGVFTSAGLELQHWKRAVPPFVALASAPPPASPDADASQE
jgi:hypothetical protein